jgi:hypothetical protein
MKELKKKGLPLFHHVYTIRFNIGIKLIKEFSIYAVRSDVSHSYAARCTSAASGTTQFV